jgi:hypothetical protein
MRLIMSLAILAIGILPVSASDEISVERGRLISIIGGCHGCHTDGYSESEGAIDPAKALRGRAVGWRGPWGTTYAGNLRLRLDKLSEDGFVGYLKTLRVLPPMPWYAVRQIPEGDMRSLYRYIKSLGDPGDDFVPADVPPDEEPKTSFIVLAPPQMPKPCASDFECGVGKICGKDEPRACVAR